MKFLTQLAQSYGQTDRHEHKQTGPTEIITYPHTQVVMKLANIERKNGNMIQMSLQNTVL